MLDQCRYFIFRSTYSISNESFPRPPEYKSSTELLSISKGKHFYAIINYEDAYVQPLILAALEACLPGSSYTKISSMAELPNPMAHFLQIGPYESLPFEHIMSHSTTSLVNAYIIRKALIRKHYLSTTAYHWATKNPSSIIATNVKPSCDFELDYAEFLDDALVEAWELQSSFQKNEGKQPHEREWWILKPGMSDRGQGIRLFSTEEELQSIFEEWEADRPESDDDGEEASALDHDVDAERRSKEGGKDYIVTSHLRHFIAQPYIHPPLLLAHNSRKFHIRTYVLASGSLEVYVYKPMLALFASTPYTPPWSTASLPNTPDLSPHLTNTCLQTGSHDGLVNAFWELPLPPSQKAEIFKQICETTGEIFEAAANGMMVHFQTLPNAFEVFGLDFLVDEKGVPWLLEVNAFPDFRQTGEELKALVGGLWEGVMEMAVGRFFGIEVKRAESEEKMVLVRKLDLGRR
jgi:tubulin--tyrosine ligase